MKTQPVCRAKRSHKLGAALAGSLLSASTFLITTAPADASGATSAALPAGAPMNKVASDATAAHCATKPITITEEDYYGPAAKVNPGGLATAQWFQNYTKQNPCIDVVRQAPVATSDAEYNTHVLSQFSSNAQPDILMLDNPQMAEFAQDGLIVPFSSVGKLNLSYINPANIKETTYNGKLYALPLYTNTIALFYNKTLLQKAHITTLPTTWAQFSADLKKLTTKNQFGFVFSGQSGPGENTWQFLPWLWSNGGSMTDPSSPQSVQALNFLVSLVKDGTAPKDVVNWSQSQPTEEFEAGKAAFAEDGDWIIGNSMVAGMQAQYPKLKWGVIPFPTRTGHQTVFVPFGGEVWTITKTNPVTEEAAFKVLSAMAAPSNQTPWSEAQECVPTDTSLWSKPPWNNPVNAVFYGELRHGRPRTFGIANAANEPAIELDVGNAEAAALVGTESPQAAMESAQKQVDPLLK